MHMFNNSALSNQRKHMMLMLYNWFLLLLQILTWIPFTNNSECTWWIQIKEANMRFHIILVVEYISQKWLKFYIKSYLKKENALNQNIILLSYFSNCLNVSPYWPFMAVDIAEMHSPYWSFNSYIKLNNLSKLSKLLLYALLLKY
jgi:hypothetical protein